eukprot:CAMPEP_0116558108 /NCGR_PEP_ID=MMETSP0397-20121206/9624_1 /TAXON_ID=216820 /ORGANISM="Cyclophora tenuis, Strain ECT3854" /LENGTH=147 /DNA_ID=CAMNT_0004083663 /DNA_START=189 /DNA_END=632 /DNA_ORIENTATION=-
MMSHDDITELVSRLRAIATETMKVLLTIVCCLLLVSQALGWMVPKCHHPLGIAVESSASFLPKTAAAILTTAATPLIALAEESDMEFEDLPPPYIPVIFGVGLLVGVGLLTGSLGNLLDEEASLGLQSGAKAKKEQERARSSYFKNK